jgi:predicted small secreted protein
MIKTTLAALFALSLLTLAGCNTVAGAGQDVSNAGTDVHNAAERSK